MNINICKEKELCTGCSACEAVCPKHSIKMKENSEGFRYPHVDSKTCINCGLCEKTCPVNNLPQEKGVLESYVVRHKNENILIKSTSGGSFTAFADYAFRKNGVVYGVGFDENFKVRHFGIDSSEAKRVSEMICSKYVQSDPLNTFSEVKTHLNNGRLVLYSGTPCQIAGLKSFLKKDYDNLITIDLVCRGVASPALFRYYVDYQKKKYNSEITDIRFRNKTYGYHSGSMKISFKNGKVYTGSARVDYMLKSYFKGFSSRLSCYNCPFKRLERSSDFTIFDSWHSKTLSPETKSDDKGYTNIYVRTDKACAVMKELSDKLDIHKADYIKMKNLDGMLIDTVPPKHPNRNRYLKEISKGSIEDVAEKYLDIKLQDRLFETSKNVLYKTGLLSKVKSLKKH